MGLEMQVVATWCLSGRGAGGLGMMCGDSPRSSHPRVGEPRFDSALNGLAERVVSRWAVPSREGTHTLNEASAHHSQRRAVHHRIEIAGVAQGAVEDVQPG